MATPIFKFNHHKSKEDFYFIYDTYFELPQTTPMCLATFVYYHIQTNRTLSGFMLSFDDINNNGSSLYDSSFYDFFNEKQKGFFLQQVEDTYELRNAEILREESKEIRAFLTSKEKAAISIDQFLDEKMQQTKLNFRGVKYYHSLSFLYDTVAKLNEKQDDLPF